MGAAPQILSDSVDSVQLYDFQMIQTCSWCCIWHRGHPELNFLKGHSLHRKYTKNVDRKPLKKPHLASQKVFENLALVDIFRICSTTKNQRFSRGFSEVFDFRFLVDIFRIFSMLGWDCTGETCYVFSMEKLLRFSLRFSLRFFQKLHSF